MQGKARKVVQAVLYEAIAVLCVAPALSVAFHADLTQSTLLSLMLSGVALVWSMFYNWAFEYWEARQPQRRRTLWRRFMHATGFEGGLVLILLPVVAAWLQISVWAALLTNVALFLFFFVYAFVFQWTFDRVFDVPDSAREPA